VAETLDDADVSIASPPPPELVVALPEPVDPTALDPLVVAVSPDVPVDDPKSAAVNSPPQATKRPNDPQTPTQLVYVIVLHRPRLADRCRRDPEPKKISPSE